LASLAFSRQRSWDSTLRSFAPAGQFHGISAVEAHVSFACRILLDGFSRGIDRQNC
jgi:hypothetical protein